MKSFFHILVYSFLGLLLLANVAMPQTGEISNVSHNTTSVLVQKQNLPSHQSSKSTEHSVVEVDVEDDTTPSGVKKLIQNILFVYAAFVLNSQVNLVKTFIKTFNDKVLAYHALVGKHLYLTKATFLI